MQVLLPESTSERSPSRPSRIRATGQPVHISQDTSEQINDHRSEPT